MAVPGQDRQGRDSGAPTCGDVVGQAAAQALRARQTRQREGGEGRGAQRVGGGLRGVLPTAGVQEPVDGILVVDVIRHARLLDEGVDQEQKIRKWPEGMRQRVQIVGRPIGEHVEESVPEPGLVGKPMRATQDADDFLRVPPARDPHESHGVVNAHGALPEDGPRAAHRVKSFEQGLAPGIAELPLPEHAGYARELSRLHCVDHGGVPSRVRGLGHLPAFLFRHRSPGRTSRRRRFAVKGRQIPRERRAVDRVCARCAARAAVGLGSAAEGARARCALPANGRRGDPPTRPADHRTRPGAAGVWKAGGLSVRRGNGASPGRDTALSRIARCPEAACVPVRPLLRSGTPSGSGRSSGRPWERTLLTGSAHFPVSGFQRRRSGACRILIASCANRGVASQIQSAHFGAARYPCRLGPAAGRVPDGEDHMRPSPGQDVGIGCGGDQSCQSVSPPAQAGSGLATVRSPSATGPVRR